MVAAFFFPLSLCCTETKTKETRFDSACRELARVRTIFTISFTTNFYNNFSIHFFIYMFTGWYLPIEEHVHSFMVLRCNGSDDSVFLIIKSDRMIAT